MKLKVVLLASLQAITSTLFLPFGNLAVQGIFLEDLEPVHTFLRERYQPANNPYLFDGTPEAIHALAQLPDELLPRLPDGYIWQRTQSGLQLQQYAFLTPRLDQRSDIEIVVYGPDARGQINYLTMINGVNYQGFSHTRPISDPFRDVETSSGIARRYPLPPDDFDVWTATGWIRYFEKGHIIPFHDTMEVGRNRVSGERIDKMKILKEFRNHPLGRYYSTHDRRNYIPEPPAWNERYRRTLEGRFQANSRCFLQYPYYDENNYQYDGTKYVETPPRYTKNNTRIPEGVFFAEVRRPTPHCPTYSIGTIYDVHWESVLPRGFTVDQLYEYTTDPDKFLPYPAISQFEQGLQATSDYVANLAPKIEDSFNHRVGSYTALDKVLHLQSLAASHQFTRPAYALEQAFDFSGEFGLDRNRTRHWIVRGLELTNFMDRELGGRHEVISQREMEDLEYSYRNEELGFEDTHSREIDHWRQFYRHQEERHRH